MRLVLADCALRDPLHHYLHFDALVVDAAARWGAVCEVYGCAGLVEEARLATGAAPHFQITYHELLAAADPVAAARAHARELWDLVRSPAGEPTAWFVPIASAVQVLAWTFVLARRPLAPQESLTFLWNPVPTEAGPSGGAERELARGALRALGTSAMGRPISVVFDTEEQAAALGIAPGVTRLVLPVLRKVPKLDEVDLTVAAPVPAMPVFAVLGDARLDKGFDLAVEAIARLATDGSCGAAFVVQGHHGAAHAPGVAPHVLRLLELASPRARVLLHPLKVPAYAALLGRIHAVILPYRVSHYATRTSTVFAEAALRGLPVVATAGTWMEREFRYAGSGLVFPDGDVDALTDCLRRAAAGIGALLTEARRRQPLAARRYDIDLLRPVLFSEIARGTGEVEPYAAGGASGPSCPEPRCSALGTAEDPSRCPPQTLAAISPGRVAADSSA